MKKDSYLFNRKLKLLVLSVSTCSLILSGCGKNGSNTSTNTANDEAQNAYIAEYLADSIGQTDNSEDSNSYESLSSFVFNNNDLYYLRNYYYYSEDAEDITYDDSSSNESDNSADSLSDMSDDNTDIADDSTESLSDTSDDNSDDAILVESVAESYDDFTETETNEYYIMKYNSETNVQEEILDITSFFKEKSNSGISVNVSAIDMTSDGELIILCNEYNYSSDDYEDTYILYKFTTNGELISQHSVSDDFTSSDTYVYTVCITPNNTIAVSSYDEIFIYDTDLNYKGSTGKIENGIDTTFAGDSSLYYLQYGDSGMELVSYDTNAMKSIATYDNLSSNISKIVSSESGMLYYSNGTSLYSYNPNTQTKSKLADWLDSDINGNYINAFSVDSEENVYLVLDDYDNNTTSYIYLKKVDPSVIANRIDITIGTVYSMYYLTNSVLNFNKEHPEYHIKIKQYYDDSSDDYESAMQAARLALVNDINSGALDLISIDSLDNIVSLNSKGALEDLNSYISNSSVISADDLQPSIIKGYTYDNKLIALPKDFTINTLISDSNIVGNDMGLDYDTFFDIANSNTDKEIFSYNTKNAALYTLIAQNLDDFINWETGDCEFNTDKFIRFLEYANSLPDDTSYDSDKSTPARTMSGDLLFAEAYISSLYDLQEYMNYFPDQRGIFIGYPTTEGVGTYLQTTCPIAISSKSAHKDIAWNFIEYFVTSTNYEDSENIYDFPILKSQLSSLIKSEQEVKYVMNTDGSYMLDENGEKIISNSRGTTEYDDWSYTFHFPTDEEAQLLQQLIDSGKVSPEYNTNIINIINEESEAYFEGQKTVNEVADIIQSRINIYVHENM